jgi:hypothetical protein
MRGDRVIDQAFISRNACALHLLRCTEVSQQNVEYASLGDMRARHRRGGS